MHMCETFVVLSEESAILSLEDRVQLPSDVIKTVREAVSEDMKRVDDKLPAPIKTLMYLLGSLLQP